MKSIILSDHPGDKVKERSEKRQREYDENIKKYSHKISERKTRIYKSVADIGMSWVQREFISTVKYIFKFARAVLSSKPVEPKKAKPGFSEILWEAGRSGEKSVSTYFEKQLTDEWTLLTGYRNNRGEIDQLLVGPHGVYAIEIKHMKGVIYCDGDNWWHDKYDRYGNLVEKNKPIKDKGGRGPSAQLNEPANKMQQFLMKRTKLTKVLRVIVFSHESASLGVLKNISVDFITSLNGLDLEKMFAVSSPRLLKTTEIQQIVELLIRDHNYYNASRNMPVLSGQND